MTRPRDFWVLRSTPISEAELATLIVSPLDLEPAGPVLGRVPNEQPVPFSGDNLYRWRGPGGTEDILVSASSDGIHITEGGAAAKSLADSIASVLGGWVREG
jgi:hypothetical protein